MAINQIKILVRQVQGLAGPSAFLVPASVTGTVDAIVAHFTTTPALSDALFIVFNALGANTVAPTFSHDNGGTVLPIIKNNQLLIAGDIAGLNSKVLLNYSTVLTSWVLINPKTP